MLELEAQYLQFAQPPLDDLSKTYRRAVVLEHTGAFLEAYSVYQATLNCIGSYPDTADGVSLALPDQEELPSTSVSLAASMSPAAAAFSAAPVFAGTVQNKPKHVLIEEIVRKIVTLLSETNCCGAETTSQIANHLRWQFETNPKLYENWNTLLYSAAWHQRHQLEDSFVQWAASQFNNPAVNHAMSWRGRLHALLVLNDHAALLTHFHAAVHAGYILPADFDLWKALILRTPVLHRNAFGISFSRTESSSERHKLVDRLLEELLTKFPDDASLAVHRAHLHTEDQGFVVLPHS